MKEDEIVKIPQKDRWLGSCPICGKSIWLSYRIPSTGEYKCIECREEIPLDNIIPF